MPPELNTQDPTQVTQPENNLTSPPEIDTNAINNPPPIDEGGTGSSNEPNTPADASSEGDADASGAKKTPWFQRRIDQLTAEKWEERRASEALRKQTVDLMEQLADARKVHAAPAPVEGSQAPAIQAAPQQKHMSDAEIDVLANQRAEQISRQRSFDKACNDVAAAGKDEYADFDQSLRTFQMLGGIPTPLLEVITEMPNAHKVLYNLGKDPDLAERVVKMSPTKQALELARLEQNLSKPTPKQVSAAPAPVKPIDATSRASENMETMSMEDFIKAREKHLSNRKK